MKEAGVQVKQKRAAKYSSYAGEISELAPNVLDRDFKATRPYQKIVTDISQFNVGEEKVYLSPFIDLFSNRIISFTLSKSPSVQAVTTGLKSVISQIPDGMRTIIHSDQGMHYQHINYREIINNNENIEQSMSRKGNCLDNGACESFFGRIKEEMFVNEYFESIEDLVEKLEKFFDYYNNNRLQVRLGGLTPMQHTLRYFKENMQEQLTN